MNPLVSSILFSDETTGASSADLGETIDQSLRFRSSQTQSLTRTPASAGNRQTWTYSFWYKPGIRTGFIGETGVSSVIFLSVNKAANNEEFAELVLEGDRLTFQFNTGQSFILNPRQRDTSAWYHYCLVCDITNGTSDDRVRIYINGDRITDFSGGSMPGASDQFAINLNHEHAIGIRQNTTTNPLDGLMAEINFVDGTAIGDTNDVIDEFGRYNEDNVWVPKAYEGSYGTNGYRLTFDSSQAGISTIGIGTDSSGQNNNWIAHNFDGGDVALYSTGMQASTGSTYQSEADRAGTVTQPELAFSGSTADSGARTANANEFLYWVAPIALTGVTSLRVFWNGTADDLHINGASVTYTDPSSGGAYRDLTAVIPASGTISEIAYVQGSSGSLTRMYAVEINGTVLVDNTDNDVDFFDTPTRTYANYSRLIPNDPPSFASAYLDATAINNGIVWSTQELPDKHLYAEFIRDGDGDRFAAGVADAEDTFDKGAANDNDYAFMIAYSEFGGNASIFNENTTATQTSLTAYSTGDVLGVEWRGDLSTRQVNFYINGTQVGSSENVASGGKYYFAVQRAGGTNPPEVLANFGQMPFLAAPSGVTNTANGMHTNIFEDPTIKNGEDHFVTVLDTGANIRATAEATFTNGAFLIHTRADDGNDAQDNQWQWLDTVRGGNTAITFPFNTSGSTGNFMSTYDAPEQNSFAYCWNSGSPAINGFEIIEDSSPTTGNNVITHNLGKTPEFIFSKETNNSDLGNIYHASIGTSGGLTTANATEHTNAFRVTAVSSTQFTIADSDSSNPQIHYVWTSIPGFSQFGEYDTAEAFVYTGFKPALLWIKKTGVAEGWWTADNKRNPTNPVQIYTRLFGQGVETTSSGDRDVDFLSNGFRIRGTDSQISGSAQYVYMCWAEHPFGGSNVPPATAR